MFCLPRDNNVVNDPAVKQTVVEQTNHWSEMIDRHQKENWELMKAHLQAQEEVLKKLMQSQQQLQIKELEAFFEKYVYLPMTVVKVALPQSTVRVSDFTL